ncbi:Alpha/Beta hydrolase protein [Mycena haematopus]|nr:Alpha/Beta hydrolase protein [Mycena haematopus]
MPCLASGEAPTVTLNYGVFQGVVDGNLSTFLGVPFAKPAYDRSFLHWTYFLSADIVATVFGPACPQQAEAPQFPVPPLTNEGQVSEDCLKLNVFAPRSANLSSSLPVLVWIYGGAFEIGNSPDTEVRPVVERSIATGEPVIIATPNYRLSAFGFLAGKEVGEAGISNLGLRDQIFALEWVKENIRAFGGDPECVVIGGPSTGAISASLLLLSNKRFEPTELFRGAFMLSGSPISTGSVTDGQPHYNGLVAANNCTGSSDTLDCLRQVPFDVLMATVNDTTSVFSYSSMQNIWRPRVDGDVVVQDPLISVSQGLYAKVPIISGDSDDEGTSFSVSNDNITTNAEFLGYLHSNYLLNSTSVQIVKLSGPVPGPARPGLLFHRPTYPTDPAL